MKTNKPLKRRKGLRPMSDEMMIQKEQEKLLAIMLFQKQGGKCARCGEKLRAGWFSKHEIKRRSAGGDPLDENNTELLCAKCHTDVTEYRNPDDKGVHR